MVHYYCPFLQCQKISESIHSINFVGTSVVCSLHTVNFTEDSVRGKQTKKMTDSNKVLVLYMNLVPVLYQVLHGSLNFEQVQPPYTCSVPGTSRYKYPVLVRTSTVQPGMYQAPYLFCTRYRVPGTSTRYWYVPLL